MTTHIRQQLREAITTALTGLATTGARVHKSRMRQQSAADLPCLLVTVVSSKIDENVQGVQSRNFSVSVRGFVKSGDALDDTLDQIAFEVETALGAAGTLSGLCPSGLILAGDDTELDDTMDKPVGVIALDYQAICYTQAGAPGVSL